MTEPLQLHEVQPPPDQDPEVSAVARILTLYASYEAATAALAVLLEPYKIGPQAIKAALLLTRYSTKHRPRPKGFHDLARQQAYLELHFRAAYLLRAAQRIQRDLDAGYPLPDAVRRESIYRTAHDRARARRQRAMQDVIDVASRYGSILGWYLNRALNNEAECIAASGNNFDVLEGTVIGYPGTVHVGCGCRPGKPWPNGGWVNEAVVGHITYAPFRSMLRPVA